MGIYNTDWNKLIDEKNADFAVKILDNRFIQQEPFYKQVQFLISDLEELLFGGQAGGSKTSALLMSALMYCDYLLQCFELL